MARLLEEGGMSKVYLLWKGDYSEAYVAGAYSTEEKARAAALEFNIKDPFIREEEVDTPPALPEGWWAYEVSIGLDFKVRDCRRCSAEQLDESHEKRPRLSQGVVIFYLSAKDERGAIKSASDRLRVWKASGGVFDAASTAGLPNPALTPLCAYLEEPDDVS